MEQYEFSCSGRPSADLLHPIECQPKETPLKQLYVRIGELPSGEVPQFYDFGAFYFATVGMQAAATIGELWVTYDVEFFKPRLTPETERTISFYEGLFTATNTSLFSTLLSEQGDVEAKASANEISLPAGTSGQFLLTVYLAGNSNWSSSGIDPFQFTGANLAPLTSIVPFLGRHCPSSSATSAVWASTFAFSIIDATIQTTIDFVRHPQVQPGECQITVSFI